MGTVTIIGSGNMARAIATRALAAGDGVQILDSEPAQADNLATELGGEATGGAIGDPLAGDIVVLAVPYPAAAPVVTGYGERLNGKTVVDITNPVDFETFDRLITPPDSSAAEEIAAVLPSGARLVKAFNTTLAGTLQAGQVGGMPLDVLIAGDDQQAKAAVVELVEAGGQRAVDAGPLRRARQLEHAGFLHMVLQRPLGTDMDTALKFVS